MDKKTLCSCNDDRLYPTTNAGCIYTAPPGGAVSSMKHATTTPFGSEATGSLVKNPFTDNPCGLSLADADMTWRKSQAGPYLDSLMFARGSGKLGSIAGLDQKVDKMITHSQQSTVNCGDISNQNSCTPPDMACEAVDNKPCEALKFLVYE